jgi:hypothetical protein
MTINNSSLATSPTFDDNGARKGTLFVDPSQGTFEEVQAGVWDDPVRQGQLRVQRSESTFLCSLYCSIETSPDVYEWKRVQPITSVIDARTGRDWDPNAGFIYSYAR